MTQKRKELRKLKELEGLTNLENLTEGIVQIVNKIREDHQLIRKTCKGLGLEEKTIDAMMEGRDVISCNYCNTHNMCEIFYNKKDKWTMYECYHCEKTWMIDNDNIEHKEVSRLW